jgi:hypothetical protein
VQQHQQQSKNISLLESHFGNSCRKHRSAVQSEHAAMAAKRGSWWAFLCSCKKKLMLILQIEKSREMYKAVMKQVVTFLERAHRSLELLGNRLNTKQTVPRSKSEHQIVADENGMDTLNSTADYAMFRDFTW